jgi:hypothetical protein
MNGGVPFKLATSVAELEKPKEGITMLQHRYLPNPKYSGRKERDGFVCSTTTGPGNDPICVAVKIDSGNVQIRDTKDAQDVTLTFTREEWGAFINGVKNGEFEVS